jgi:tyrosyl-tRNA synthetase
MNKQIEDILNRGVEEVIDKEHLRRCFLGEKKLRVKLGIDPTSPNIHIGRAVVLWKLRAFQEMGHKIVFIVGDFTGLIGDTSDKDAERPMMSEQEMDKNMKSYFDQASKILDKEKTEMHYNSTWLKPLGFKEIGAMADVFGLHEFAARENIAKRLKAGKRVSLRELMYPLMQGYDSVAIKADVELGGTDQKFNLLAGRTIQKLYKQEPQDIMTMTLMEGTDGRKMSSSWGNVINITDEPNNMFGKVMSINDDLIKKYFLLATRVPMDEVDEIIKSNSNPRDQKLVLAEDITSLYHGKKLASEARENFISQFTDKELPKGIETISIKSQLISSSIVAAGMASSKSEAKRLINQGGVKYDNKIVKEDFVIQPVDAAKLLQVGKRKFKYIKK